MVHSGKQIVSRIRGHIRKRGGVFAKWFVGVSKEPRSRLFVNHAVRKKGDYWILVRAESSVVAQRVKSFLVAKVGMAAVKDAAGKNPDFVYAYMKSSHTKP